MKSIFLKSICVALILTLTTGAGFTETLLTRAATPATAAITAEDGSVDTALTVTGRSNWKHKVVAMRWYDGGSSVLDKGDYGYIYDIESGVTIKIKRMGGTSHADVEPASKKDTAKLKKACGYSWDRRPVILYADGKFVACSINTMPHGDQTIGSNGYNGQFCLHMLGSKTHGSDKVDEDHMKAIKKAYNWAH